MSVTSVLASLSGVQRTGNVSLSLTLLPLKRAST